MRIATINIWNARTNWARRLAALTEEVTLLNVDLVAMQEVPVEAAPGLPIVDYFLEQTAYLHARHLPYPGPADKREWPEGLAFLSKQPLTDVRVNWAAGQPTENSWGARATLPWQGRSLSVTNVHLDWRHAASRERHIVRIVRDLIETEPCDVDLLCGDFNDDGEAPSLRFLAGQVALDGYSTRWRDLAADWHAARGETPPVTLDFEHNPRWQGVQIRDHSKRFDRVYLRAVKLEPGPRIRGVRLFGKEPANSLGVVPSDHYGLVVDLDL